MDALSFNPLQSGVAAASVASDPTLPDGGGASIDFSTLLALGMNPDLKAVQQAENETGGTAETGAVPPHLAQSAPESPIALPQPLPVANMSTTSASLPDANGSTTSAALPDAQSAEVHPAQVTDTISAAAARSAADARSRIAEGTSATVVADEPANIAGDARQAIRSSESGVENQIIEQRADTASDSHSDIMLETRLAAEAVARTGAQTQAVQIHPAESRGPLSQPSALLEVQAPVSEPGFAQALSRQVVWMVDKDAQVAELRINPPELGPVEVRLTLTHDSAAAEFVSPHAEVRAAIENAIVRLRESMAEAGIQLGEASVSAESFSNRADGRGAAAQCARWLSRSAVRKSRRLPVERHGRHGNRTRPRRRICVTT